jgi:hypothetical protein
MVLLAPPQRFTAWSKQGYAEAAFPRVPECVELSGHRADIMRNEHALMFRRQRQNIGVLHVVRSRSMHSPETLSAPRTLSFK